MKTREKRMTGSERGLNKVGGEKKLGKEGDGGGDATEGKNREKDEEN